MMLLILSLKTHDLFCCVAEVFQNEIMGCVKNCFCFAEIRETNMSSCYYIHCLTHIAEELVLILPNGPQFAGVVK